MKKSTKFVWMYLFLAASQCQIVIDRITLLILKSSKKAYQHNDQNNGDSEQVFDNLIDTPNVPAIANNESISETQSIIATCTAQTTAVKKQSAPKHQANTAQVLPTRSPSESNIKKSKQQARANEKQRNDENQESQQGNQHKKNAQQPKGDDRDKSNDNQDRQDKQQDDDPNEDDQHEDISVKNEDEEEKINEDDGEQEEEDPVQNRRRTDATERIRFVDKRLRVKGLIAWYPSPREKRFTPHPQLGISYGRPIPEMLKPSKSQHRTRFKKSYEKKCKQQQDERINSREEMVSTEPYEINLLNRRFYYNDDGTENLYDGPEEIATKLGLEYKGSPIATVYASSPTVEQTSGPSSVPRTTPKIAAERVIPEDSKPKNADTCTRITLAAYKEDRRRKLLERNQS
ncbi:uncharacterized protein ATC70_007137 [Mucor velutinosus]|uniref:Uncharacterized protein n=1 Tax=Mucor velutinosus TaxID=708070 RepID=A0AAN7D4C4_9FUNG|nr:hypothetical protein ATC70_007137 [Mucor velutinosus]